MNGPPETETLRHILDLLRILRERLVLPLNGAVESAQLIERSGPEPPPTSALQTIDAVANLIDCNILTNDSPQLEAFLRCLNEIDALSQGGGRHRIAPKLTTLRALINNAALEDSATPAKLPIPSTGGVVNQAPQDIDIATHSRTHPRSRVSRWSTTIFPTVNKIRRFVELAIVSAILAILGFIFNVHSLLTSSTDEKATAEHHTELKSGIAEVPDATARRVAELIGINASLNEDGPLRDLAKLAQRSESIKQQANQKVNSGRPNMAAQGASDLLAFAKSRRTAVSQLTQDVAEDFRQAGAAYIVAGNLPEAQVAYEEAARVDPMNINGLTTLSNVALAAGNLPSAERAALAALARAEVEKENRISLPQTLAQLGTVYLTKGDIRAATSVASRWEGIVRTDAQQAAESVKKAGTLKRSGIVRLVDMPADNKGVITVFFDGDVLTIYKLGTKSAKLGEVVIGEVIAADTLVLISRHQMLRFLFFKSELMDKQGNYLASAAALKEGVTIARTQVNEIGIAGVEYYLWPLLERLADIRHRLADNDGARRLYEESLTIHRRLAARLQALGSGSTPVFDLEKAELFEIAEGHRRSMATMLEQICLLDELGGNERKAIAAIHESVALRRQLVNHDAKPDDKLRLAIGLFVRSGIWFKIGHQAESCQDILETRTLLKDVPFDTLAVDVARKEKEIGCSVHRK